MTPPPASFHPAPPDTAYAPAVPRPPRPPLSRSHRRRAVWAGMLSFFLIRLGSAAASAAVIITLPLMFSGLLVDTVGLMGVADTSNDDAALSHVLGGASDSLTAGVLQVIALGLLIDLALTTAGIVTSWLILRGGGVHRPWATTWTGYAVATGATWAVTIIVGVLGGVVTTLFSSMITDHLTDQIASRGPASALITFGAIHFGIQLAVLLALSLVIGPLCWRWMASALRAPGKPPAVPQPS